MSEEKIKPEKITKPIQLLAAWLVGLLAINTCFLVAATNLGTGKWETGALVVAAILNVPLFLLAVFLLQTRFRPELQEDSYYSSYLSNKTNMPVLISRQDLIFKEINAKLEKLELRERLDFKHEGKNSNLQNLLFGINKHLTDKDIIKSKLSDNGVFRCTSFGSEVAPINRNISISIHLPNEVAKEIIILGKELGFQTYNMYDNIEEESDEDVLLGSYGGSDYEIV